jgi:hypothetical protein
MQCNLKQTAIKAWRVTVEVNEAACDLGCCTNGVSGSGVDLPTDNAQPCQRNNEAV